MYDAFRKLPKFCDVLRSREWTRAKRVSLGHGHLVADYRTALEGDDDPAPKRFFLGIMAVIALGPADIFDSRYLVPERDCFWTRGALGRVGFVVVPTAILQRDCENIHDRVVKRFPARLRVHLLRIVGAGADHIMRMMTGMDHDALDPCEIADLRSQPPREINQSLALIFGRVLFRIGIENRQLGLTMPGQQDAVF